MVGRGGELCDDVISGGEGRELCGDVISGGEGRGAV